MFFGRTHLRIGASRAKNCEGLDFEVRSSANPPKLAQKGEKQFLRPKIIVRKQFCSPKIEMLGIVWSAVWQSFVPIRAMFEGKWVLTRRR